MRLGKIFSIYMYFVVGLLTNHNILNRIFNVHLIIIVFTARCTLVQSAVLPSHVVCLSVCNVGEL